EIAVRLSCSVSYVGETAQALGASGRPVSGALSAPATPPVALDADLGEPTTVGMRPVRPNVIEATRDGMFSADTLGRVWLDGIDDGEVRTEPTVIGDLGEAPFTEV